jgi:hypothetical protein
MNSEQIPKGNSDKERAKSPADVIGAALFLVTIRALFIANIMTISKA